MALRRIVYENDPFLRKQSREVKEITGRIRELVDDMWETMYESKGVGLAAPQVGVLRRVAVIDVTPPPEPKEDEDAGNEGSTAEGGDNTAGDDNTADDDNAVGDDNTADAGNAADAETLEPKIYKYVLINPEIVETSSETVSEKEGCLSVPGRVGIVGRPAYVKVRAIDIEGNPFEVEGEGMLARALFHEMDHLNGIVFTDIAESVETITPDEPEDEAAQDE